MFFSRRGKAGDFVNRAERIKSVKFWWHTLDLNGDKTPGVVTEKAQDWIAQAIPQDLRGKTVLDIGAWDGYFSFLAEKRGAKRVLAIDNGESARAHGLEPGLGFGVAKEILKSSVEYRVIDVYDLDLIKENFDVIFAFGLYYHLRHPLYAFEKMSEKCKELLILEGYIIKTKKPIMIFYESNELSNDPSNWWGASVECLRKMAKSCGFEKSELVSKYKDRALLKFWR